MLGHHVSFWDILDRFKSIFAKDHLSLMAMPLFQNYQVVLLEFDCGCFGSDLA